MAAYNIASATRRDLFISYFAYCTVYNKLYDARISLKFSAKKNIIINYIYRC